MNPMKKASLSVLAQLVGNSFAQDLLQRSVVIANYLMGIGSGAHTSSSGEVGILRGRGPGQFEVGTGSGREVEVATEVQLMRLVVGRQGQNI